MVKMKEEVKAALKILNVLKDNPGTFILLKHLARKAGFNDSRCKSFRRGLEMLCKEGIVNKYKSGWPSEGFHGTGVVLIGDIYVIEDLQEELRASSKSGEEADVESIKVEKYDAAEDLGLVPVLTPLGHVSYVSREEYYSNKDEAKGWNFWRPIPADKKLEDLLKEDEKDV
jgi:hypothetical protein